MITRESEKEGKLILNIFNIFKLKKCISESECLIKKYDINFKLPELILRYDIEPANNASLKTKDNKWYLKINKKHISDQDLKYSILHEFVHYWIGSDFDCGYDFSIPEFCPNKSDVKCFQVSKKCSPRKKLYCLLFQKINLEPKLELTKVGTHTNKYFSFEEVIVNSTVLNILDNDRTRAYSLNYKLNLFENEILSFLKPYMPNLPIALDYLFKNYNLETQPNNPTPAKEATMKFCRKYS